MRLRSLLAVVTLLGALPLAASFVGCGSDDPPAAPAATSDAGDGSTTSPPDGSTSGPNPVCKPAGQSCANSVECCTANCDAKTKLCGDAFGICKAPGEACAAGPECCTVSCVGGTCGNRLCTSDNQACAANAECCGGSCVNGLCKPLNSNCKTSGNKCAGNAECCSKVCNNGICAGQPSFCTQGGDACISNFECCGGNCNKAAGTTLGICEVVDAPGTPGCLVTGQVCSGGAIGDGGIPDCGGECCSRACAPYGKTGVMICQPPSGCRPTGETCSENVDCCGFGGTKGVTGVGECSKGDPNQPTGRCDNGNACRPAGAICKLATMSCNAENSCCTGNVNQNPLVCQQDLLGIPRCTAVGSCGDAGSKAGLACATSVDCCGLPCVPNPAGSSPAFICGGICVPTGGSCTTNADCCPGIPCVAPPGSTKGVCGGVVKPDGGITGGTPDAGFVDAAPPPPTGQCVLAGQVCTSTGQCCNGLSCSNGRCQIPIK